MRRADAVDLGVPVEIAFVVRVDGTRGRLPQPGRADRVAAEVSLGVELADDVEALLVRDDRAWIVGIDVCAAKDFGLQRVELTVRENNVNAIALYKKVGFEIEGVQREAILVDGKHENLILMGLLF